MKTSIFKYLPMAAALTIATACSNDDENIIVPQPVLEAESVQPEFVKVPFTVKVDSEGKSLSKIGTEPINDNGTEKIKVSFKDEDVDNLVLLVEGTDEDYNNCFQGKYQVLTLKKINGEFVFTGDLEVKTDYQTMFQNGQCDCSAYLMTVDDCATIIKKNKSFVQEEILSAPTLEKLIYTPGFFESSFRSNQKTIFFNFPYYACFNIGYDYETSDKKTLEVSIFNSYANPQTRDYKFNLASASWFAISVCVGDEFNCPVLGINNKDISNYKIYRYLISSEQ